MALVVASVLTPLPLLPLVPHLALQAYSVALVRSRTTACAAPLLAHPTTARHILAFHRAMHLLVLVLPGGPRFVACCCPFQSCCGGCLMPVAAGFAGRVRLLPGVHVAPCRGGGLALVVAVGPCTMQVRPV